jgi:hypothetical protein
MRPKEDVTSFINSDQFIIPSPITLNYNFPLQPRPLIQKILHLPPWPVRVQRRVRPYTIPSPLLLQLWLQLALQHLHHVLAQHGEELVPVEGAAGSDVETLCGCVRRDDEVGRGRERVPR